MKETLEECGFIYYLILARLWDVDPRMYQKEGIYSFLRIDIVSLTFVFLMFLFYFIFSRATVSAVLQPCCTCHMLFVLLARCVVCVLGK